VGRRLRKGKKKDPYRRRKGVAIPTRPGDDRANLSRPEATMTPSPPLPVPATAQLFHLLGDPTRLRLLLLIRGKGEACVGDVAAAAGMSREATTYHLKLLRLGGVVGTRRAGQQVFYRVTSPPALELLRAVGEG
jgi:ArsR family transcriptional regulator, lead/cadmium/zinc/bismuth-responsive transcriptional repressor